MEKNSRGLLKVEPTLQLSQHDNVFALGDIACSPTHRRRIAGTAQLAFQQAGLAADNVKAFLSGDQMETKHFEELGEAISLGTERAAVLAGGKAFGGALARQARDSLCTRRVCRPGTIGCVLAPVGFSRNRAAATSCRLVCRGNRLGQEVSGLTCKS